MVVGFALIFGRLLQNTPLVAESYVLVVKYGFGAQNLQAKHTILPYPIKIGIDSAFGPNTPQEFGIFDFKKFGQAYNRHASSETPT